MISSVSGSWKTYRSGLCCYHAFMDLVSPHSQHFPVQGELLQQYSSIFSNGDTMSHYFGHLRFGARLTETSLQFPTRDLTSALTRGAKKLQPPSHRGALRAPDAERMVLHLLSQGHLESARLLIIGRSFMCRVSAELGPLEFNGPLVSTHAWHSQVLFRPDEASIRLRTRKNSLGVSEITRLCQCSKGPQARLLCGVCALRGLIHTHSLPLPGGASQAALISPPPPGRILKHSLQFHLRILKAAASSLGIDFKFHNLRRGMAQDMLSSNHSLPAILAAGAWRSGAFLRYLSRRELDAAAVLETALEATDSD